MELAEILKKTSICSLIKAKPNKRKQFIYLDEEETIKAAMSIFIEQEIEAVPIKRGTEFVGNLTLLNLLVFFFRGAPNAFYDRNVPEILNLKLSFLINEPDIIQPIEFVNSKLSLLHLLIDVWGGDGRLKTTRVICKHLLTITEDGKYEIITPLDFLRYILLLSHHLKSCLNSTLAVDIENGFDVDENLITHWDENIWVVTTRMIQNDCPLAIVNDETGGLEANITFTDLLPTKSEDIEECLSLMRRPGLSLYSYLRTIRYNCLKDSIDPIILYPHFTVADLIEKLTRLKIHYLWRVTRDMSMSPLGAVGVTDIIRYLNFMCIPFLDLNENLINLNVNNTANGEMVKM